MNVNYFVYSPRLYIFASENQKNVVKIQYCILGILGIVSVGITAGAADQTYRVSCGRSPQGVVTYREVYEFDYVTVKPEFPGGDSKLVNYINKNRQYPKEAYKKGVQGRVTCSFVVNTDGSISHIQVLRGVESSINAEAVRLLSSMPAWVPGKIDGQTVPVRVTYTVPFRK